MLIWDIDWLNDPDIITILLHGPVRGEVAASGYIEDRHAGPGLFIEVCFFCPFLAVDVGFVICHYQVFIMGKQGVDDRLEQFPISR